MIYRVVGAVQARHRVARTRRRAASGTSKGTTVPEHRADCRRCAWSAARRSTHLAASARADAMTDDEIYADIFGTEDPSPRPSASHPDGRPYALIRSVLGV